MSFNEKTIRIAAIAGIHSIHSIENILKKILRDDVTCQIPFQKSDEGERKIFFHK